MATGRVAIVPSLEVFNLLNSNVVLSRSRIENASSANEVAKILSPRSVRLNVLIEW